MTDDKKPNSGDLLGQGEPGHPAVGRGPNAGGEYSQEDYHHPAAAWGAAKSVGPCTPASRRIDQRDACRLPDEPRERRL